MVRRFAFVLLVLLCVLFIGCEYFALPVFSAAPGGGPRNTPQVMGAHTVAAEEYLTLRNEPDTAAKALRRLERGAVVTVREYAGRFALVEVRDTGETGYVLSSYLVAGVQENLEGGGASPDAVTPDAGSGAAAGQYRVQCEDFVTLRAAPSPSAKSVGRLANGDLVSVGRFDGPFARITAKGGKKGYVLSGYLLPVQKDPSLAGLRVVKPAQNYSHEKMMGDLRALAKRYPKRLRLENAGVSAAGREVPVAVVGSPKAKHHVLVQAAIHGREHMTALLVMAQLEYCLQNPDGAFAGGTVEEWLEDVCLHIIPMANPDGVVISQDGGMTGALNSIYQSDQATGRTDLDPADYLQQWKANGAGVDINRNFPTGWQGLDSPESPSAARYKGQAAGDQPETRALMDYTKRYRFDATVSYHATGSCVYWQYGEKKVVNQKSKSLAQAVSACTQYPLLGADGLDAGGYKDWAMDDLEIPSVTVEVGSRPCPLPLVEFSTIWARNRDVLPAVARWVKQG